MADILNDIEIPVGVIDTEGIPDLEIPVGALDAKVISNLVYNGSGWIPATNSFDISVYERTLIGTFLREEYYTQKVHRSDYEVHFFLGENCEDSEFFICGKGCTLILKLDPTDYVTPHFNFIISILVRIVFMNIEKRCIGGDHYCLDLSDENCIKKIFDTIMVRDKICNLFL